ncbi:MAG: thioesterase family protein [Holophagaceae bacterium]
MPEPFTHRFEVGWGDLDFNGHMRNTAYLDLAATVRMMFFRSCGFEMAEFERLRFGPVVLKDEVEYYRELKLLQPVVVGIELAGVSADGARFRIRNTFSTEDGQLVAKVTSTGGWMDLNARRLGPPPAPLRETLERMRRAEDFEAIRGRSTG